MKKFVQRNKCHTLSTEERDGDVECYCLILKVVIWRKRDMLLYFQPVAKNFLERMATETIEVENETDQGN
jgi:hypothetical protein